MKIKIHLVSSDIGQGRQKLADAKEPRASASGPIVLRGTGC